MSKGSRRIKCGYQKVRVRCCRSCLVMTRSVEERKTGEGSVLTVYRTHVLEVGGCDLGEEGGFRDGRGKDISPTSSSPWYVERWG